MASSGRKNRHTDKGRQKEDTREASAYYRLHTKAVQDLVEADESNSPVVSPEELNKYRSKGKLKLPTWLKVVLIKAWFYGAVCFFFMWGLGMYVHDQLDLFVITAIALGMVTDLLVNTIFRYYAETEGANDKWMMFPKKGLPSFFWNILYAFPVLFLVSAVYNVLNVLILAVTGAKDTVPLGVEPILFGLFYMGIDMGLIAIKHAVTQAFADAKTKASGKGKGRK